VTKMIKSYSYLITLPTFEDRYEYLQLNGRVGEDTFGHNRYLNQLFYHSPEWRAFRDQIIIRDNGCDLAIEDRPILDQIYIHHLNPITVKDIEARRSFLMDPENVVCVSFTTHNAIHYGDESLLINSQPVRRTPNDTCLWR
jgi:hypothetical protein